ncbi:MAG: hypothetical protein HWE30_03215 [Methylocystaceae bacterium]|nr:hypothetical protein [Methylocystaceae bacterium]
MINSKIIAHRFGAGFGPENTAATLERASKMGVRWVEFDASLLKDGNVIVFHDDVFDRCTDATGPILEATLEDVRQMDAGSWFDPTFKGEAILELRQALKLLNQYGMNINLEIKVNGDEGRDLVERVHTIVSQTWPNRSDLLYSSFSHEALVYLRSLDQEAQIGHLFEDLPEDWQAQAQKVNAITIHADSDEMDIDAIRGVKDAGYPLYLYTVNDAQKAESLISAGVDAIFTDHPERFPTAWL